MGKFPSATKALPLVRSLLRMSSSRAYQVVATVPTGLERGAGDEYREVLGREALVHRGSISCTLESVEELMKIDRLRSIDNYHTVIRTLPSFCQEESTVLQRLETLPFDGLLDWTAPLSLWQFYTDHIAPSLEHKHMEPRHDTGPGNGSMESEHSKKDGTKPGLESQPENTNVKESTTERTEGETAVAVWEEEEADMLQAQETQTGREGEEGKERVATDLAVGDLSSSPPALQSEVECRPYHSLLKSKKITFRVTCTRGGRKHTFSSQEAAQHFGAGLARYFGWKVQLKNSTIEVLLDISGDAATVGLSLTRESKYKRNISHFGPTTLRSTIAYGMLRIADIQPGDIVLDPLCGGGSVNIEGSLSWPDTYHLAGDKHELAVPRAAANVSALLQEKESRGEISVLKIDVCRWDVCRLPLRTASIDVVVTDLPFGKKSGSKAANWELYPKALQELGRVCRPQLARGVLLTHDHRALSRSLQRNVLWKRVKTLWLNVGGLEAALFILQRSSTPFSQRHS